MIYECAWTAIRVMLLSLFSCAMLFHSWLIRGFLAYPNMQPLTLCWASSLYNKWFWPTGLCLDAHCCSHIVKRLLLTSFHRSMHTSCLSTGVLSSSYFQLYWLQTMDSLWLWGLRVESNTLFEKALTTKWAPCRWSFLFLLPTVMSLVSMNCTTETWVTENEIQTMLISPRSC